MPFRGRAPTLSGRAIYIPSELLRLAFSALDVAISMV